MADDDVDEDDVALRICMVARGFGARSFSISGTTSRMAFGMLIDVVLDVMG